MYVTNERFRTMGLGVDLDRDDIEIRSALYRAGSLIHSYCSVPMLPQQHDFRGGTITNEVHEWKTDMYEVSMTPFRFWPWHQPVRTITSFRIYSTPAIYTEVDPDEIFINNSAGFIEVSSLKLTQYGVFGAGVVTALVGMWNPQAVVSYTYGRQLAVVGELLEATDAQLFRSQHQWWDSTVTPEIKVNGVVATVGFTIDYDEGTVLFTASQAADTLVTASYTHKLPSQIADAEAIIAADDLGQAELRGKGMTGVDTLTVGEITIRRASAPGQRGSNTAVINPIPPQAQALLSDFIFTTIR